MKFVKSAWDAWRRLVLADDKADNVQFSAQVSWCAPHPEFSFLTAHQNLFVRLAEAVGLAAGASALSLYGVERATTSWTQMNRKWHRSKPIFEPR